jgi:membrane protein required for beta-lactamase induction
VALCGIVLVELNGLFGLFGFVFSVMVLVYCLGPKDLHELAHMYIDAIERSDNETAKTYATRILKHPLPKSDEETAELISHRVLISVNQSLLGVFFWFVVLGPMGALLFRLSLIIADTQAQKSDKENEYASASRLLLVILNWIPNQLCALSFAVTGSFPDAFQRWRKHYPHDVWSAAEYDQLLAQTGLGALHLGKSETIHNTQTISQVLELSRRSVYAWLTALAILTLAGWAG